MTQIAIPPPIIKARPEEWDACNDFNPVFDIRLIHFSTGGIFKESHELFRLTNEKPITIFSNSSLTVEFPVLFITSLPASCVLMCDSSIHRYKLFHNINVVSTNDTYPHITLFNDTNRTITIPHFTVYCRIVLTRKLLLQ